MKLRLLTVGLLGLGALASAAGIIDNKNQASISSGADKPENAKKPKVLVVIGDATELLDTMYPVYRLQEAGFQPVFATPEKRVYGRRQMAMTEAAIICPQSTANLLL